MAMASTQGTTMPPPPPPPEEVVIDGDSTEDDEEVAVVVPKRKRQSLIADEEDEGEAEALVQPPTARLASRSALEVDGSGDEQSEDEAKEAENNGEDDEDDEVEIIAPPTSSVFGSGGKSRRLTILTSDDEQESADQQPAQQEQSAGKRRRSSTTPTPRKEEEEQPSSSTRRSSRIEKKRKEKELVNGIVRRLDYPALDNCLDNLQQRRDGEDTKEDDPDYQDDEEDEDEDEVFEVQEQFQRPKKRQRREESNREVLHADGGEDLDEFIVGDDEVEYMDDDEHGVISVESSGSEGELDAQEEMEAMRATRSRDQSEWFSIYLDYLEEAIVDPELERKMRRPKGLQYRLFTEAIHHIERVICSRRDSLRVNVAWPEELVATLHHASQLRWDRIPGDQDCDACNRSGHTATYRVHYAGVKCDATELYRGDWMQRLRKAMKAAKPVRETFEMGSTCHSRTLAYWQLLHAKQMWCVLVDAKRREFPDSEGRIAEAYRKQFHKQEYGRFKRLVNLVEKFSTETRQNELFMPNVWKKVTRRHLESEFLPTQSSASPHSETRRGTMDSFVGDSEEDEADEDEEAVMEEDELARAAAQSRLQGRAEGEDKGIEEVENGDAGRGNDDAKAEHASPKQEKSDTDAFDDLKCLVCRDNPRDAAIVHGLYVHYYCCFGCGKRQHREKRECLVCKRKIDRVLRLLPLTAVTRRAILQEQHSE